MLHSSAYLLSGNTVLKNLEEGATQMFGTNILGEDVFRSSNESRGM